ncbi:hypothetical protein BLNAU_15848 [Blattamonas nauphoetae]|uniref:Uncharacterized protein n=1 Tax=Blattamonas nauphoetae TaxID=2049346 RepID=A0ABQ9XDE6_9EUKA|nr:hypothetical protein BLNAU_15848 [Blattamonas nauphoetae]
MRFEEKELMIWIYDGTNTANAISNANTVGCTSTSALPRIAYYDTSLENGVHPQQETILPQPSAGNGSASLILHVQIGAKGNECSEASPCSTIDTAFGKVGAAFALIELGLGMFTDSSRTTEKSFELQGRGFISNDTKPTTFTTGGITSTGNITLSAMSIKPATPSVTLLTMTAGQTRLSHIELEDIADHDAYLFSFTGGNAAVRCSTFASMTLKSTAVMSFSGSTTVSIDFCWFYNLVRQDGLGGTCMDSSSTSTISITRSDFTNCSSSGRAGCCDFVGSSSSKVAQSLLIFINNSALIQTGGKGNDVFMTGFTTQPSINTNCRSNSTKPHVGQESGTTVTSKNMYFPDLSFSSKGMPHPVAYRIEQGTPLSYFSSFNEILDQCEGTGATIFLQVAGSSWHMTNPHDFNNKRVSIKSLQILCTPQATVPLFRIRNQGFFQMFQSQFNLNHVIDMPFVMVEDSSSTFTFEQGTLHLTSLYQTRPLFVVKDGSFVFLQTSISKSGPYSQTGCSFIENTGGSITLTNMRFQSFITSANGSVLNSVGGSVRLNYPMFQLCEAKNGGALCIELNGSGRIIATHVASATYGTTFHSCVAVGDGSSENPTGKGGAIYVKGTSTSSQPIAFYTTNVDDARFEKNRAAEGNDLYVEKSLFESVPTQDLPKFRGGSLSDQHHVVIEGREPENAEEIGLSIPFPIISVNGSVIEPTTGVSGSDNENCKWTSSFCSTVRYGIRFLTQKYKNDTLMPMTIKYVWNMTYHESDIIVASQDVTVTGTTTSNQKTSTITRTLVKTNETAAKNLFLFTIEEKAIMTVTNIDFIAPSKHGLFDLTATGESVTLDNLAIISEGGVEHIQSVIRTSTGPVSIFDCVFNSSSETPAVYSLPVVSLSATDKPFTFESTSFMSLSMKSSSVLEIETEGEISLKSVKFTDCVRTNTPNGYLVHIKTTGIETKVTPARWAESFNDSTLLEHFSGLDKGKAETDMWQTTPLLFFLLPSPTSSIRMSSSSDQATTHPKCGTPRLPCSTLHSGISSVDTHLQSVLEMATDGSIVESVIRTSSLEIKSTSSTKRTITLNDAASFVMNGASKVLLFNTIQFLVDLSCTSSTLFVVQLGTVSLKTCLIGSDSKVTLPATTTKLIEVHNGATLALEASTLQRLSFGSEEAGTLIYLCTGSTFIRDNDSVFSEVESKGKGTVIYVEASSLSTVAGNTSFAPFKSQLPLPAGRMFTPAEKALFFGKEGSNEWSLLYYWYPHTVTHLTLDVTEDGEDHVNCGISQLPCQTLVHGWSKLKVSGTTLQLSRSDTINTTLTTKFSVLTLATGPIMSNADQTIVVGTEGSLVVSTDDHTLILQNQKFILESPRSTSAFSISAGSLSISSCSFGEQRTVTTFEASTLIAQTGGNLKLTSCSFTDIVSTGNGSVLNALVSAGKSLIVVDGSVSGCSTTGNGGALHVTLHETGRFEMTGTTGMSFSNCEALVDSSKPENTTGLGQAVHILVKDTASVFTLSKILFSSTSQPAAEPFLFIQAPSLASSITSTSMAFLSAPFSESDLAKYEGFEDTNLTVRHPLVLFLLDVATGYLKSTGNDSLRCGLDLSPCQTLSRLTSRLLEDSTATGVPQFKILIVDSGLLNSSLVIGQYSLDVEKSAHTASLHMNNGQFSIPSTSTSGLLSVKSLELKWSATPTKILDLAGGHASIDSCSIAYTPTTDTFSSTTLFSVTGGILTITSLSLDMQEKKASSVVALNGGAVVLSDCTFEKGKLQASLIDGTGSITLPAGTFISLVDSSDTQAHAISSIVTSDQTVSIGSSSMTTSFTSCSSSGNGGALHVKVSGTGSLSVTHTSFSLCSSSENGGAVSLDLSSMESTQFTFTSVGFGSLGANSNGVSKKGQNVFVVLAQAQIPSLLTSDKWTGSYLSSPANSVAFTESEKNLIAFSASSDTRWSLLHVLFAYASGDVFVDSSNGESNAICGQSVLPCSSLSQGYTNLAGSSVKVRSSIDLDDSITSKAGSTSITSNDASIRSVSVLSGKGITISTGTVTFLSLKFILTASGIASPVWTVNGGVLNVGSTVTIANPLSSAEHASNVILVSSGTLSVASLILDFTTKLSLKGSSFISQSGGIITWTNVSTSSVSSVSDGSASGTTIHSSIGSGSSLTIGSSSTTTSFTSCSSNGNGGALAVAITSGSLWLHSCRFEGCSSAMDGGAVWLDLSQMPTLSQYSLLQTEFGTGSSGNKASGMGDCVFVVGDDLERVVVGSIWRGSFEEAGEDDLWGRDDASAGMSLLLLLRSQVIGVGEGGSDEAAGTVDSPFKTLHRCFVETEESDRSIAVVVVGRARIGESCWLVDQPGWSMEVSGSESGSGGSFEGEVLCSVSDEEKPGTAFSSARHAMITVRGQTLSFFGILFSSFSAPRSTGFVFSLLSSCSLSSSSPIAVSLVSVSGSSSFSADRFSIRDVSFVGKACLVQFSESSEIALTSCSFSSVSLAGGALIWGTTRGGMKVANSEFFDCSGEEFGSVIRIEIVGITGAITNNNFRSCWTRVRVGETSERRVVGGGCVVVEMMTRTRSTRRLRSSCVDLSLSSFSDCTLTNTDTSESSSSLSWFVGGSGFLIFGNEKTDCAILQKVRLSRCLCRGFEGMNGFDGGVVVGRGHRLFADRRDSSVGECQMGSVQLR